MTRKCGDVGVECVWCCGMTWMTVDGGLWMRMFDTAIKIHQSQDCRLSHSHTVKVNTGHQFVIFTNMDV